MRILRKPLLFPLLILIFAMLTAGCAQKAPADVRIELETPDGSDVSSSDAVFPRFVSKNEDCDYVGILAVDGAYFICPLHSENPPLCEVDFEEFFDYLK